MQSSAKMRKKISTVVPLRPERVNKYVFITTRYVLLLVLYLYVSMSHLSVFLILLTSSCEAARMLSPTWMELPLEA